MNIIIENEYLGILIDRQGMGIENPKYSHEITKMILKRIRQLKEAKDSRTLREIKSLHFEKLTGNLKGKYSIRINLAFRMIFRIGKQDKIEILYIEDVNNHYS